MLCKYVINLDSNSLEMTQPRMKPLISYNPSIPKMLFSIRIDKIIIKSNSQTLRMSDW